MADEFRQPPVNRIEWGKLSRDELLHLYANGDTPEHCHAALLELDARRRRLAERPHVVMPRPAERMRQMARQVRPRKRWFDGRSAAAGSDREDD